MHRSFHRVLIIVVLLVASRPAQYFGRNKVQYEKFDFKVLRTENFGIYYYPVESLAVVDAARMLERWRHRFTGVFRDELEKPQPVILYANHADFQQTNVISDLVPQGTGGVTEALRSRMVIPLTGVSRENDHVLGHELAHAYHFQAIKNGAFGVSGMAQIPLWFIEGMSEYLSLGSLSPLTAMWMRDAVLYDKVPDIAQIGRDRRYFPYRYGHALWAYIAGVWGDDVIAPLFDSVLVHGWARGCLQALGITPDSLSRQWQRATREVSTPFLRERTVPGDIGTRVISGYGGLNISPVISPDGNTIAFMSARGIFSIDLFLADARTGRIIKKLAGAETDEHFDALRFYQASGAWSPDGNRFAFVVFRKGDNAVSFLDVASRKTVRTLTIPGVDEISHLTWSPDGGSLLLSGTSGGIGDLYLYSLKARTVRRLTNDRYADLQPAFSPDGRHIAFATDRGPETDLDSLRFGPLKLGIMDVASGEIEIVSLGRDAKHISPQFSPDGNAVYLVADPDGFSDIYRYDLDTREFDRVTRVATGVTGITENSPALSVSRKTGRLVFSVFEKAEYNIYSLGGEGARGQPFQIPEESNWATAVALPPSDRADGAAVDRELRQSSVGLSDLDTAKSRDYHPSLRLMQIGQAFVGASVDRFGTAVGGGISALFGDLLGDHLLGAAVQVNGGLLDIGGEAVYFNRKGRLNWGGVAGHVPYLTTRAEVVGDSATRELRLVRQRVFNERAAVFGEYPLTLNRRIELTGGVSRTAYSTRANVQRIADGRIVEETTRDLPSPEPLYLAQFGAAYVGDFSFFGFTSPLAGRRYRLELEPTVGTITYTSILTDYRQYHFQRPVAFALRLFHYGRYLRDANSERLSQLFVGFETLVRGYGIGSFDLSECQGEDDFSNCPEIDRLLGSKLAVANVEVRLPVTGTERLGLLDFPYVPTTLVAFLDGGAAWTREDLPQLRLATRSLERIPVFSAGTGIQVNILGVLVLQFYYAYAFQRPDNHNQFGFVIAPGW